MISDFASILQVVAFVGGESSPERSWQGPDAGGRDVVQSVTMRYHLQWFQGFDDVRG